MARARLVPGAGGNKRHHGTGRAPGKVSETGLMSNEHWQQLISTMKKGGYYDAVLDAGPELQRVQDYLRILAGQMEPSCPRPDQRPCYPCFPGLEHTPFHETVGFPGVATLESAFEVIRAEAQRLPADGLWSYVPKPVGIWRRAWCSLMRSGGAERNWTLYPLYHMGVNFESVSGSCPKTIEIIESLPRVCLDYPWGDALFSLHEPGTHLPAHSSVDNLRVRCHLGLEVPEDSEIRVGDQYRRWDEGKCLLFDDSIEHEVWNRSSRQRLILIVDFWNPALSDAEIAALTAGFRKSEVRQLFYQERIRNTSAPSRYIRHLKEQFALQDAEPGIKDYWAV